MSEIVLGIIATIIAVVLSSVNLSSVGKSSRKKLEILVNKPEEATKKDDFIESCTSSSITDAGLSIINVVHIHKDDLDIIV